MEHYDTFMGEIEKRFSCMSDFDARRFTVGKTAYCVFYIRNFSSRDMINKYVIEPLAYLGGGRSIFNAISSVAVKAVSSADEAEREILAGSCVIISSAEHGAVAAMTKNEEGRSPDEPETENVIRGAHEGFTENGGSNAALIRRRIKTTHLKKEDFTVGGLSKTEVSIMYLDDVVRSDVLDEVRHRIRKIKINGVLDSGYVEMYIQDGKYAVFPTVGNSERPDKVAAKILEGRVAVIVDGSPVVLTVPYLFIEGFQVAEDYSKSVFFATLERILRFGGTIISLFLPAMFLAASASPEIVGSVFSDYVNAARENIKIPLAFELIAVFVVFELVREVGLRMPKAVGSAVGIVGSLVIGDSAVSAGIISAPVLMVVAFSAVCNFLAPPYMNANVIYRAVLILSTAIFGMAGFFVATTASVVMFASKDSFKTPYMTPLAPFSKRGQGDFLLMLPIWRQKYLPRSLSGKNAVRAEKKDDE